MKGLIFTYLLTYGGSLVSLFNPFYGLLIYVCFAIVRPEDMWRGSVPEGGSYSRIVAISLLVGWLIRGFGDWRFGKAKPIVYGLIAFWLWSVVGALKAPDPQLSWGFVESFGKILLPFLVGITTMDNVKKLKQLAWVIVVSQGYVAYEMNFSYYVLGYNRVNEEGFGGIDNNCVAIGMVTCVGVAFFLGLTAPKWWLKVPAFACACLMVNTIFLSFSRGAMLALLLVGLIAFFLVPKRAPHYLAFAVAVLIGLRLAGREVTERFTSTFAQQELRDESAQSRIELWKACIDTMEKYPVLGVGPEHWGLRVVDYGFPKGKFAHTLWLQIGAELGIPALFCLLVLFYGYTILRLWPLTGRNPIGYDPWLREAARMVVAALIGFCISAQFVSLWGLETPYYVALIGAGALKLVSLHPSAAPGAAAAVPYPAAAWRPRPAGAPMRI